MKNVQIIKSKKIIMLKYDNCIVGRKHFKNGDILTIIITADKREICAELSNKKCDVSEKYACTVQHVYSKHGIKGLEFSYSFVEDLLEQYEPKNNLTGQKGLLFSESFRGNF